jgi:hypothetical protein
MNRRNFITRTLLGTAAVAVGGLAVKGNAIAATPKPLGYDPGQPLRRGAPKTHKDGGHYIIAHVPMGVSVWQTNVDFLGTQGRLFPTTIIPTTNRGTWVEGKHEASILKTTCMLSGETIMQVCQFKDVPFGFAITADYIIRATPDGTWKVVKDRDDRFGRVHRGELV